jgi:hypothetical protein
MIKRLFSERSSSSSKQKKSTCVRLRVMNLDSILLLLSIIAFCSQLAFDTEKFQSRILTPFEASKVSAGQIILANHECLWAPTTCPSYSSPCSTVGAACQNCYSLETQKTTCFSAPESSCTIPNPLPFVNTCPGEYSGTCAIIDGKLVCWTPPNSIPNGNICSGTPKHQCRLDS